MFDGTATGVPCAGGVALGMQAMFLIAVRAIAVVTAAAIVVQFEQTRAIGGSAWNFVSFFTIQSNVIAIAAVLAAPANPWLRGAATLNLAITGVVYAAVLARNDHSLLPWVNACVHYAMPAAFVLWWLAEPPRLGTPIARLAGTWMLYPALYVAYALIRGEYVHWYPYPFLDPRFAGYPFVARAAGAIAVLFAFVAYALAWYATRGRSRAIRP